MKTFNLILSAVAFSLAAVTVSAETVARALVTQEQGSVWLYDVDEKGDWTINTKIVDDYDSLCSHPLRAVYKNGVIYVTDYKNCAVFKYNLSGEYLGVINTPGFVPNGGLAVTPDGATLFVGSMTNVVQIDTATGIVSEFHDFGSGSRLRDMETDGNGHLYVADRDRDGGRLHIFNYNAEEGANVPTSVAFNFCEGVGYDPAANLVYVAGNDKQYGIFHPDGSEHTALTEANTSSGWCIGVACVGGMMYYESYSAKKLYRLDVEENDFTEIPGVVHNSTFKGADVSAVVVDSFGKTVWNLDDGNGAAASFDDGGVLALRYEGGVRMAEGGVSGNCAVFASGSSRMTLKPSDAFIPATGNFAVFFRVGLPASESETVRHLFSNAIGSDGDFAVTADNNTLRFAFTPIGGESAFEINTTATVADGKWHHVGLLRNGARFELWMDGERLGTVDVGEDAAIAADRMWSFGSGGDGCTGFVGAGAFYDDIMFTDEPPTVKSDIALIGADRVCPESAPVMPERPAANPMPASLGVQVAHVFANEEVIAMPSILISADGSYYVSCDHGNGACDSSRSTSIYRSTDRGATWTKTSELQGHSVSLFEQDGVLCAVGLKAGLGYPASVRTFAVWTNSTDGVFAEAASMVAPMDCKLMPSPAVIGAVPDGRTCLVLAVAADNDGLLSPAWVRFDVSGTTFSNGEFRLRDDRGFVDTTDMRYTTFSDALGGIVIPKGVNFISMYSVIDREASCPEVMIGPERVAYQNVLGNGNWSRFRFNQFRGGAKPFNVRKDAQSSMYYALTVPSTNSAELADAYADEIVGTLALYASPDPEYMAWYPCGVLDTSDEFGFAAPAFAFDGDDLIVACAVSAPDGCGVRARNVANYLSFRRFPSFRSTNPVQKPDKSNRTRAFAATGTYILKYYRTPDGEWQPDGVLVGDTNSDSSPMRYVAPSHLKVRGKRLFVLNSGYGKFCELDLDGNLVASYTGPSGSQITGMDISEDGSRALLACGEQGVWECNLADNTLTQRAAIQGDLVIARDVAILPDGGFLVTNYKWGDYYTLRYDASGTSSRLPVKNSYFTGVALAPDAETCYIGKIYGSVWRVNLSDNTYSLIRNDLAGSPYNGTYCLSCGDGKLWITSEKGFVTAYDPVTSAMSTPLVQLDYPTRGIAFYEYTKPGFVITVR